MLSPTWYLGTFDALFSMTMRSVSLLNVVAGTLTVAALFGLFSLTFPGLIAPLVATLLVATAPAHVAVSASLTSLLPMLAFLVFTCLAMAVFRSRPGLTVHLLVFMVGTFALFTRPEAPGLVLLIMCHHAALSRAHWRRWSFALPFLLLLALALFRLCALDFAGPHADAFLSWELDLGALALNSRMALLGLPRVPLVAMVLWAVGLAARPWRTDPAGFALMTAWLAGAILFYFHVDLSQSLQLMRISIVMLVPLAWLGGHAAGLALKLPTPQNRWALALILAWLLLSPLIHQRSIERDYPIRFQSDYLTEA